MKERQSRNFPDVCVCVGECVCVKEEELGEKKIVKHGAPKGMRSLKRGHWELRV